MGRVILIACVALLSFSGVLMGALLQATRSADEVTRTNERRLLQNHLQVSLRAAAAAGPVQLTWDDAMRAAGGQGRPLDSRWADLYFGQFLTTMVHADRLFLVTPDGALLRGWQRGRVAPATSFDAIAPAVRRQLQNLTANRSMDGIVDRLAPLADGTRWPINRAGYPLSRWSGALVRYQGKPAMMTVISITPDATPRLLQRTPNHMVTLRYLDPATLNDISNAVLLRELRFNAASPTERDRNSFQLRDDGGRGLGWLS
ncbi:MAG: CHASE4 domain-containing protein [Pseudomonadota bacterium]